jgi:hypothetical protein
MAVAYVNSEGVNASTLEFDPETSDMVIGFGVNGSNDYTTLTAQLEGVGMDPVVGVSDDFLSIRAFRLKAVTSGDKTFVPSGGTVTGAGCISASGIDQSSDPIRSGSAQFEDNNGGASDTLGITIPCQIGDLVVCGLAAQGVSTSITWSGVTEAPDAEYTSGNAMSLAYKIADSTSIVVSVTFLAGFNRAALIGFALKPAEAGVDLTNKCKITSAVS